MPDPRQPGAASTNAASAPRRRRRWWFKPLALLIALLVIGAIGEFLVRFVHGAPLVEHEPLLIVQANEATGWMMLPDTPHYMYHHRVAVNALGLRGLQIAPKRDGECRVLALGDSMVYGQGVGDDETVPVYMEKALRRGAGASAAGPRPLTVINGGLRGFSTNQELGLLKQLGPAIEPDVVVLFYYWNDVVEHDLANTARNLSRSGPVVFETKSRLEGWERVKWDVRKVLRRSALLMWLYDLLRGGERPTEREIAQGMGRLERYVREMKRMSEEQGFALIAAIVPDPNQLRDEEHLSRAVEEGAIAIFDTADVPVIRLLDAVKSIDEGGRRLPVIPYDGHYNASANAAMAEHTANELRVRFENAWPRSRWRAE